ncbi:Caffeoylshikimate esterase [Sesamum alatum]|uniref:Caffeoylshikimate esterase n=1 Tax=Sesamum alatum TaxID=300844 RepID=A0AAE2CVV5_9LAMI|nr:Caffeoylshikimate esterase [Sesamum alatum]
MGKYKHPVAEANETSPFGELGAEEFYARHSVTHASEYITSKKLNLRLFTQVVGPARTSQRHRVRVHGFTGESSWFVQLTAVHVAKHGFAVCAIDHMGHGYSEGLVAHLPDMNLVVDECILFFNGFRAKYPPELPAFLYAESLGGAIALLITLRREGLVPERRFDGVVLNGAMCGISDKFKPPWPLEHFLSIAAFLIPTWCVVPTRGSLPDVSFKVEWKRKIGISKPQEAVAKAACSHSAGATESVQRGAGERSSITVLLAKIRHSESNPEVHQIVGELEENVELVSGTLSTGS